MAIYTKTGDKGKTSLFSNERVWKDDLRIEAYGTIDELNSVLGICESITKSSNAKQQQISRIISEIQSDLLSIGSTLADRNGRIIDIDLNERITIFEQEIDKMTQCMPALSNFILPGGTMLSSILHLARSVARRAERRLVSLNRKELIDETILVYVNRLSDLLFTAARFANFSEKKKDVIWQRV